MFPPQRAMTFDNFCLTDSQKQWHLNKRFLIVDDEPYNLMGLKIILAQAEKMLLKELHGDEIMEKFSGDITDLIDQATNGQKAVEAVKKAYKDK